jgi:hypothetical protein
MQIANEPHTSIPAHRISHGSVAHRALVLRRNRRLLLLNCMLFAAALAILIAGLVLFAKRSTVVIVRVPAPVTRAHTQSTSITVPALLPPCQNLATQHGIQANQIYTCPTG